MENGMELAAPLINLGAVGVCLVAAGIYLLRKDAKYEARLDQMLQREHDFQEKYEAMAEKYRLAMEKFNQALDIVIEHLPKGGGK